MSDIRLNHKSNLLTNKQTNLSAPFEAGSYSIARAALKLRSPRLVLGRQSCTTFSFLYKKKKILDNFILH